jgi:predicted kinase
VKQATLYLMMGYPASGKTTTSRIIHDLTGATHIWSDYERIVMFGKPTHSSRESHELYSHLNEATKILLSEHQSVIFDANFNFRKDRDLLRSIADSYNAVTKVIWVQAPKSVSRTRAISDKHASDNNYPAKMSHETFKRISGNLEMPGDDEHPIILDGKLITPEYVAEKLQVPNTAAAQPDSGI